MKSCVAFLTGSLHKKLIKVVKFVSPHSSSMVDDSDSVLKCPYIFLTLANKDISDVIWHFWQLIKMQGPVLSRLAFFFSLANIIRMSAIIYERVVFFSRINTWLMLIQELTCQNYLTSIFARYFDKRYLGFVSLHLPFPVLFY